MKNSTGTNFINELRNHIPTILTVIGTLVASFLVFQIDYKKTDNELLNINADNFVKLYEYQNAQITKLTKRLDSLEIENRRLRDELTMLRINYYRTNEEDESYYVPMFSATPKL